MRVMTTTLIAPTQTAGRFLMISSSKQKNETLKTYSSVLTWFSLPFPDPLSSEHGFELVINRVELLLRLHLQVIISAITRGST